MRPSPLLEPSSRIKLQRGISSQYLYPSLFLQILAILLRILSIHYRARKEQTSTSLTQALPHTKLNLSIVTLHMSSWFNTHNLKVTLLSLSVFTPSNHKPHSVFHSTQAPAPQAFVRNQIEQ